MADTLTILSYCTDTRELVLFISVCSINSGILPKCPSIAGDIIGAYLSCFLVARKTPLGSQIQHYLSMT